MLPEQQTQREALKSAIVEIDKLMTILDATKLQIKDIISNAKEDTGVKISHIRKLAKLYHEQNADMLLAETEETVASYEILFESETEQQEQIEEGEFDFE